MNATLNTRPAALTSASASASTPPGTFYTLLGGMARWLAHSSTKAVLPMQRTSLRQMQAVHPTAFRDRQELPDFLERQTGKARPNLVRVIRLQEPGLSRASVGRMVMSGRLADVCAELDRLVAREAALH